MEGLGAGVGAGQGLQGAQLPELPSRAASPKKTLVLLLQGLERTKAEASPGLRGSVVNSEFRINVGRGWATPEHGTGHWAPVGAAPGEIWGAGTSRGCRAHALGHTGTDKSSLGREGRQALRGSGAVGSSPALSPKPQQLHTQPCKPWEGIVPGPGRLFPNESKDHWISCEMGTLDWTGLGKIN